MKKERIRCFRGISLVLITVGLCTAFSLESKTKSTEAAVTPTAKQNLVIATMKDMSNVFWKPTNTVTIYGTPYAKGTIFKGVPYNQNCDDRKFDFVTACGFKWDSSFEGYIYSSTSGNVGNDCSSAVAISLQSIKSSIQYKNINTDNFKACAKVGHYEGEGLTLKTVGSYATNSNYTSGIDDAVLKTYYKKIMPGDVLLQRYNGSNGLVKHVVLVVEVGTNYVKITDQIGRKSGDDKSSWRHEKKMTYDDLCRNKYLPIRESFVTP